MTLYRVVRYSSDIDKFEEIVRKWLDMGWKLQGGVSVFSQGGRNYFNQAITKDQ